MADPLELKSSPPPESANPPAYSAAPDASTTSYQPGGASYPPYPPNTGYSQYPPNNGQYPPPQAAGGGAYPPYQYNANNTGYGPNGGYGPPAPPITVTYTTTPGGSAPRTNQPQSSTTVVYQVATGNCPKCHIGNMMEHFTTLGICLAWLLFPCGIICCMAMKVKVCNHCRHTIG